MSMEIGSTPRRAAVAADALARRSSFSALAYCVLACLVLLSIYEDDHSGGWSVGVVVLGVIVSTFRAGLALRQPSIYARSPARWTTLFRAGALFAALLWGTGAALLVALGAERSMLIALVTTAGIVAGATTSLCPDLTLLRLYIAGMLLPVIVAIAARGGAGAAGIATIVSFYFAFLQVQSKQLHRDFFSAVATAELADARSVALVETSARAERALAAADAANRAKSEFLANMSHELRTPLTAVIGYAELLLGSEHSHQERIEYAETIRRNGEHLLHLLNDILDLSKIEAEKMSVVAEPFALGPVIADVESLMRVRATERGLEFNVVVDDAFPWRVIGDAGRVRQILLNLLGNAIKFTSQGWVTLRMRYEPPVAGAGAQGCVVIDVADSGEGISPEAQARLFAPFSQVESSANRAHQGTGLGLHISRTFARMMGGEIALESTLGKGSVFSLRLPVDATERTASAESIHPSPIIAETRDLTPGRRLDGVHLLLAEDGVDNQRLITAILRRAGASVDVADNGLVALQRALQAQAEQPYDVVLMDMEMSELDGYGATARLRAAGYRKPIVALTAHAMQAHRDRALAAGCNEHLTKPIDRAALIDTVARLAGCEPAQPPVAAPAAAPGPAATPIFSALADDEDIAALLPDFCDNLRMVLREISASVAHDDRAGLARIAHQLAGAGGSYGFNDITTAARELEVGLRANAEDIAPHVSALVKLCESALAAHG